MFANAVVFTFSIYANKNIDDKITLVFCEIIIIVRIIYCTFRQISDT